MMNINKLAFKELFFFLLLAIGVSPALQAKVPGITTAAKLQAEAEKRTQIISTEQLKKELDDNLELILVDIRLPSEIKNMGGSIKVEQNRNIPRGWLEYRITSAALSKDTPIVVYCGAGIRTPMAADTLQKMGYTNVRNYSDGYLGWKKAGLPTEAK